VPIREAQRIAREQNLDLIEVAPDASPPVCKIMDYGKYRYQQGKREKDSQRKRKSSEVKIVRLRPGTDDHDVVTKQRQAERFLRRGHKVQFNVFFKGREVTHPEIARDQLSRVYQALQALATVERPPRLQGHLMTMLINPRPDMPPPPKDLDLDLEDEDEDEDDEDVETLLEEEAEILEAEEIGAAGQPEVTEEVADEDLKEAA
jgi:translation initiation factor IF-3